MQIRKLEGNSLEVAEAASRHAVYISEDKRPLLLDMSGIIHDFC